MLVVHARLIVVCYASSFLFLHILCYLFIRPTYILSGHRWQHHYAILLLSRRYKPFSIPVWLLRVWFRFAARLRCCEVEEHPIICYNFRRVYNCVCVTIVASLQRRIAAITVVTNRITTQLGSFQRVVIHLTSLHSYVASSVRCRRGWTIIILFTRLKRTPPRRLKWVAPPNHWHTWIDEVYKEAYAPCRRWIWAVGGVPPPSIMGKFVWWYVRRSEILKVNSQNDEYLYMIDEAKHFLVRAVDR